VGGTSEDRSAEPPFINTPTVSRSHAVQRRWFRGL